MAASANSSIGMALAGKTAFVDIPKPRSDRLDNGDTYGIATSRSLPAKNPRDTLPTPPNSISPLFPPHGVRGHKKAAVDAAVHSSGPVDSDIDLHDTSGLVQGDVDQATQLQCGSSTSALDDGLSDHGSAGVITTSLLAKHHLPDILLAHGPLAIRHIMGYLTTSVPGFAQIPPAKARRLVVGALEGRGHGREGGGIHGTVEFDKVGWGRWDARHRGQPPRDNGGVHLNPLLVGEPSPPASMRSSYSMFSAGGIPTSNVTGNALRVDDLRKGASWTGDSAVFSHDEETDPMFLEDINMLENEADKMSLDGSASCSSSAPDESYHPHADADLGDITDEEDWAAIGAAALRQGSLPHNPSYIHYANRHAGGGPPSSALAKSVPLYNTTAGLVVASDSQEREAVEALMRLSNV
ncbi:MAG: DNA-binding proteins Bright/BRCAA1/RBP1 and proteins containing BRIGHT domain [Piccolia ochrophora]|nr:MAG: DNA-binding proteins Bright/BRCAA1/RBP1 and proteins containing BRIGHT domain [Piccolia ochrophora]